MEGWRLEGEAQASLMIGFIQPGNYILHEHFVAFGLVSTRVSNRNELFRPIARIRFRTALYRTLFSFFPPFSRFRLPFYSKISRVLNQTNSYFPIGDERPTSVSLFLFSRFIRLIFVLIRFEFVSDFFFSFHVKRDFQREDFRKEWAGWFWINWSFFFSFASWMNCVHIRE